MGILVGTWVIAFNVPGRVCFLKKKKSRIFDEWKLVRDIFIDLPLSTAPTKLLSTFTLISFNTFHISEYASPSITTSLPLQISNEEVLSEIQFTLSSSILKARLAA